MRPDRLSPTDLAVLWPEDLGWPQDVGLLAVLDGTALLDERGELEIRRIRDHVAARLPLLPPRFRRLLVRPPRGLGRPYWLDAGPLDVDVHVRTETVPAPGGERELLATCERLRRRRFDPSRPRWTLYLLTGLPDGRVGLYMGVHHCLVDGVAGVAALGAFVDLAVPPDPPPHPRPAQRPPTTLELLVDVLRTRAAALRGALPALRHPVVWVRRLRDDVQLWRRVATDTIPRTSLTGPVGPGRRVALVRSELEQLRTVGHVHGATVNDVLLCAVAGAFRELLLSRGESPDGIVLRAAVPVALHDTDAGSAEGNRDGGVMLALPVGEPDPHARLRAIAMDSAERKRTGVMPGATTGLFAAPTLQRLLIRATPRQRLSATSVANVPGPPMALTLAGAPILELFPLVPLIGNIAIAVGALSYAGHFTITLVVDEDHVDTGELEVLRAGTARTLEDLARQVQGATARA